MGAIHQALLGVTPPAGGGGFPTFPTLTDIWEWWEPDREGLANNDPIATLTGQVAPGAGHNFVQATSGARPTFLTNQLNGAGVASFAVAGTADWMDGVDPHLLTAVHFFIVVKIPTDPPATVQVPWAFGTDFGNPDVYPFTNGTIFAGLFSTARQTVGNPTPSLAAWRVVEVVSTSSEWTWRLDGATSGTGEFFTTGTNTVGIPGVGSSCVLGADINGANQCNIDIAGAYLCSAKLTTDRATLISYLNTRWGLSIS